MKRVASILMLAIIFIIVVIISYPIISFYLIKIIPSNIETFYKEKENIRIEKDERDNTRAVVDKWIKTYYGATVSNVVAYKYNGRIRETSISEYKLASPFFDEYSLLVDNKTKKITNLGGTGGDKFQHLYSEWVKKQVGIDDENVELYFDRASCGSRIIGNEPYIDFKKINSLENLEEQICKNTYDLYIRSNRYEQGVDIKVNKVDEITEVLNYADLIEEKIRLRVFIHINHFMSLEKNYLFIYILSQDNETHMITIMYDYDENVKKYYYIDKDSEWIEYE